MTTRAVEVATRAPRSSTPGPGVRAVVQSWLQWRCCARARARFAFSKSLARQDTCCSAGRRRGQNRTAVQTYDQSWCVAITFFPLQFPRQFPGRLQAGPRVNARRTGGTGRLSQGLGDERSAARELSVRAAGARYSRAEVAGCAWYRQGAPDFVLCSSLVVCLSNGFTVCALAVSRSVVGGIDTTGCSKWPQRISCAARRAGY